MNQFPRRVARVGGAGDRPGGAGVRTAATRAVVITAAAAILVVTTSLAFITRSALTTLPSFITAAVDITSAVG